MEVNKIYSRNSFWTITLLSLLVAAGICLGLYFAIQQFFIYFAKDIEPEAVLRNMSLIVQQLELALEYYYTLVLPAAVSLVLVLGWIAWFILKISMSNTLEQMQKKADQVQKPGKKKKDFVDQKIEQDRKRRLFLHTLSVFQREGRLLDFFDEDLNSYEDEQIGAAVRSIQEDCKKVVEKYINPKPVIDSEEGETITVEKGFDVDAVKLIGNVSGEPPFEGTLNHRGWKAGKREIPKLSDIQDSTIIIPAEVEVR